MFRKPKSVVVRSATKIKGRDVKRLRSDLAAIMPEYKVEDIPVKGDVEMVKLMTKTVLYKVGAGDDATVIAFCPDGKHTFFPTAMALWSNPTALPCMVINHHASAHVIKGADVFLPGVFKPLPRFAKGDRVAVRVLGNPLPFAVGTSTCTSDECLELGMRGKGLLVMQSYRDQLWEHNGRQVPHPSFGQTMVRPFTAEELEESPVSLPAVDAEICAAYGLSSAVDATADDDSDGSGGEAGSSDVDGAEGEGDGVDGDHGDGDGTARAGAGGPSSAGASSGDGAAGVAGADDPDAEVGADAVVLELASEVGKAVTFADPDADDAADETADADADAGDETAHDGEGPEQDEYFKLTFLQALKKKVKDDHLPILASKFYASTMINCRPPGVQLNLKKTRWKKISVFLEAMADLGIIATESIRGVLSITAIDRGHPDYKAHRPYSETDVDGELGGGASGSAGGASGAGSCGASGGAAAGAGGSASKPSMSAGAAIVMLLGASYDQQPIFEAVRRSKAEAGEHMPGKQYETGASSGSRATPFLYTKQEVVDVLTAYIRARELRHPSRKAKLVLDELLSNALFKNVKMPPGGFPSEVTLKDAFVDFVKRCQTWHILRKVNGDVIVKKGKPAAISIAVKRVPGRAAKQMTSITGLEKIGINPSAVVTEFQKKFAASASATGEIGKQILSIQGDVGHQVESYMVEHYGLPNDLVNVQGGKKPKKSKKR